MRRAMNSFDNSQQDTGSSASRVEFVKLFNEHFPSIHRSVTRLVFNLSDAEDVLQEVSVKLWENYHTLEDVGRFRSWACKIAMNHAIDFTRKHRSKNRKSLSDQTLLDMLICQKASDEYLELRIEVLQECIRELPLRKQDLVIEIYSLGHDISFVAQKMKQPPSTIYARVKRIREQLFECVNRKLKVS